MSVAVEATDRLDVPAGWPTWHPRILRVWVFGAEREPPENRYASEGFRGSPLLGAVVEWGTDEVFFTDRDGDPDTLHALTEVRVSLTWLLGPLLGLSIWHLWWGARRGWGRSPGLVRRAARPWVLALAAVGAGVAAGGRPTFVEETVCLRVAAPASTPFHPRTLEVTLRGSRLTPGDPGFGVAFGDPTVWIAPVDGWPAAGLWWHDDPIRSRGFSGWSQALPVRFLSVSLWYVAALCLLANGVTLARRRRVRSRPA